MSQSPDPLSAPPPRPDTRKSRRVRPDPVRTTATRAARTSWVAAVVVVLLCTASVITVMTMPPYARVIQLVATALTALVVLASALRVTRALRHAAEAVPSGTAVVAAPSTQAAPAISDDPQPGGAAPAAPAPAQHSHMFVTLSHRLQTLLVRMINRIEAVEREQEDPALLKSLFEIDHLATRARRQSENLAVLGGSLMQRRNNTPMSVRAVIRAAVAETEHYPRIIVVTTVDSFVRGYAVAEVIHLLAELMENATNFTNPSAPKIVVRASLVTAGLAIDIQDRGLGIPDDRLRQLNAVLEGHVDVDLDDVVSDGRIGLAVVKLLASYHGIRVRLEHNMYGGIDAAVVVPRKLLASAEGHTDPRTPTPRPLPAPVEPATTTAPAVQQGFTPPPAQHAEATVGQPTPPPHVTPPDQPSAPATPLPRRRRAAPEGFDQAPQAVAGTLDIGAPEHGLPGLPQRTGGSYLHPGLLTPPPTAASAPAGGHDTGLLAAMQRGRAAAERVDEPSAATFSHTTDTNDGDPYP